MPAAQHPQEKQRGALLCWSIGWHMTTACSGRTHRWAAVLTNPSLLAIVAVRMEQGSCETTAALVCPCVVPRVSRGLAVVEPEAGTLVIYAAKDGETALDGDGTNSPFASAFVKNLPTPGLEVRRPFDFVRDDVMEATGRKQKPFSYGSISGRQDFYSVAGN